MDQHCPCLVKFTHPEGFEGVYPSPIPAAKAFPEHFKALAPVLDKKDPQSTTAKRCIPFIEALSMGYIIPLWADLHVLAEDGNVTFNFPKSMPMEASISGHPEKQLQGHPYTDSPYSEHAFKLHNPWVVTTSPGWSCLFTSPLNHLERRFKLIDGAVDTDTYYNEINFPILWTRGEGNFLIKRGTPFVQVIPFRREDTVMEIGVTDEGKKLKLTRKMGTYATGAYREQVWHKAKDKTPQDIE